MLQEQNVAAVCGDSVLYRPRCAAAVVRWHEAVTEGRAPRDRALSRRQRAALELTYGRTNNHHPSAAATATSRVRVTVAAARR